MSEVSGVSEKLKNSKNRQKQGGKEGSQSEHSLTLTLMLMLMLLRLRDGIIPSKKRTGKKNRFLPGRGSVADPFP